ncbi:unnamed protein product [Brassica oleracea]|nr:unnamed protein product [Brassica napus]
MRYMVASNNDFTGEIPLSLCNPKNLSVLDFSNNNFSGSVPNCLSESLTVLNLRDNKLRRLPDMFYRSDSLKTLDVGHNQITGKLPRSLVSCTSLEILNVESNKNHRYFPVLAEVSTEPASRYLTIKRIIWSYNLSSK